MNTFFERARRFVRTPKGTLLLVFAVLLSVAGTASGWPLVLPHVLAAVAGACLAEVTLVGLFSRRLAWPRDRQEARPRFPPRKPRLRPLWRSRLQSLSLPLRPQR